MQLQTMLWHLSAIKMLGYSYFIFHNFDVCGKADTSTQCCWECKLLELNLEYVYQNL